MTLDISSKEWACRRARLGTDDCDPALEAQLSQRDAHMGTAVAFSYNQDITVCNSNPPG